MSDPYVPPKMPPFPVTYGEILQALSPYYQRKRPLNFFFEMYVCSVIDALPKETLTALSEFAKRHPNFFAAHGGDWRNYVIKEFRLSNTIETAIWDLWLRNASQALADGWIYHPWHYAQNFAENYFAEGSKVDVWEPATLEAAQNRIAQFRRQSQGGN